MTTDTIDQLAEMRQTNPAYVLPDAWKGIGQLLGAIAKSSVPQATLELVGLRVSQINGCGACVQGHWAAAKHAGVSDQRIVGLAAWRESPAFYDAAERAALAVTDALTRLADRSDDPLPDDLWSELATHYDEHQLSAVLLQIGLVNLFNRVNIAVKERADRPSWMQGT
jgi:AhpD family alkylhydroperoxidase